MIKAMLYRVSLLQALAVMIIISLLLPLPLVVLTYVNSTYKHKQEVFTTLNTKKFNLSSAVFVESLWNFYPELGQTMLDQLLLDPSVQFVYVKDSDEKLFLGWENKEKVANNDDTLFLNRLLEKDGVMIGSLEMGFKRQDLVDSILSDMALFGGMIFFQLLLLIIVISWIYYYKIIRPIRRLVGHSNLLAHQKLDEPFLWDENDEIGTLGFALDKTRIKLKGFIDALKHENEILDEKVKQRTKELEDTSRYKSEFLANMSHEIRTPMNAIMGMSHLLSKAAMNSTQVGYVGKIKEASSVLLRIINDILDFSKIEAGKMEVEVVAFDLHKELKKSCSIFSVLAKEKGIDFQYDFVETNRFFKGDPCKLMQIVNNFLSNAIKFTKEGAVLLSVEEQSHLEHTSTLTFHIKDSGMGIPKEKQSLLFKAFGQLDASITRKHGGTGLGLFICTQLAEMMHGHIRLESEEGRGSLFSLSVTLPLAKGLDVQSENASNGYEPLNILVIVDQKKVSESLCEIIRSFGFFVTACKSSDAIASMLQSSNEAYHLVILDHELSKKANGLDFYTHLTDTIDVKTLPPFLMIASNDDDDLKARILNSGIDSLLKKPINPSMLYDTLVALCPISASMPLFDPSKIDLSSKRILIVEDNDINLEVATYLLKETHAQVIATRNGLEAVEMIQEQLHPFDLILMDVQMPIMDGYEATRIIRNELNVLTPIVAMTANVMIQDIEKCLESGMDAHIGKPFEVEDFYGTLLETLHVNLFSTPKHQEKASTPQHLELFAKEEAIKRLGGKEVLWQKLFSGFFETYLHLPQKLQLLIEKQEMSSLIDYVHTTKGLCGTIGVKRLEQSLGVLEQWLKEHHSLDALPLERVLNEHTALMSILRDVYEKLEIRSDVNPKALSFTLDEKKALERSLIELQTALNLSNVSKVNLLLEALALHRDMAESETFKMLLFACKQFDFEAALQHVEHLSEEISNG